MSAVDPTPPFYAGDELQAIRLAAIQSALAERGLDGLLLLKHDAVRFVTGFYAKGYRPFVEFEYAAWCPPPDRRCSARHWPARRTGRGCAPGRGTCGGCRSSGTGALP